MLCDDTMELAARLAVARIRTTLCIEPAVPHIWPVIQPDADATARAMDLIGGFAAAVTRPG